MASEKFGLRQIFGNYAAFVGIASFVAYSFGYLILRSYFSAVGISLNALPLLSERYFYLAAIFLVHLLMAITYVVQDYAILIMGVLSVFACGSLLKKYHLPTHKLWVWFTSRRPAYGLISEAASLVITMCGIVLAARYIYKYMTNFPVLEDFVLKPQLPSLQYPLSLLTDPKLLFDCLVILVECTLHTALLLFVVSLLMRWKSQPVSPWTVSGLLYVVFSILVVCQIVLLPINYGMGFYAMALPRVNSCCGNKHLKKGVDAWVLWFGRNDETVSFLIRDRNEGKDERRILTMKRADVDQIEVLGLDKTIPTLFCDSFGRTAHLSRNDSTANSTRRESLDATLLVAAGSGQLPLVKELVDQGAFIDARNHQDRTALMEAARAGHAEIVRYLVEVGADVNLRNGRQGAHEDALILAADQGNLDIVKYLTLVGADKSDVSVITAFQVALENRHFSVVKYLASYWEVARHLTNKKESKTGGYDWDQLVLAAVKGDDRRIKNLLTKPINSNSWSDALILASAVGNLNAVRTILEMNGERATLAQLSQAVTYASMEGHLEIVKLLRGHGPLPNEFAPGYLNPVVVAARRKHWEIVKFLVERGMPVNNSAGGEVLMMAARCGRTEIVILLLRKGANPSRPRISLGSTTGLDTCAP